MSKREIIVLSNYSHLVEVDTVIEKTFLEVDAISNTIKELGYKVRVLDIGEDIMTLFTINRRSLVFNFIEVFENKEWQAGYIPLVLDLLGIEYIGSDFVSYTTFTDKKLAKIALMTLNIPVGGYTGFPCIVKPRFSDGGDGISSNSIVYNDTALVERILFTIREYNQEPIVEDFIKGADYTIFVLCDGSMKVGKMRDSFEVIGYREKPVSLIDEVTNEKLLYKCRNIVSKISKNFRMDYYTIDIRVKGNKIVVLEVNPNPGIEKESHFAYLFGGVAQLFDKIVKLRLKGA